MDALVTQNPDLGKYYTWDCILYPCYTYGLGLSPNGQWAVFFTAKSDNDGGLLIVRANGEKQWEIYNSDITGYVGTGARTVSAEHWTLDGRYLYLAPRFETSGGYDWFWGNVYQLIRLDLETGRWIDTGMNHAFSFSPNDQYIAYRGNDGLHIHEFGTGAEQVVTLPSEIVAYGHIIWSPDSNQLIFVSTVEDLNNEQDKGLNAYLVNVRNGSLQIVFENDKRYIYPLSWTEPNRILFESLFDTQQYFLDLKTSKYEEVPLDPL